MDEEASFANLLAQSTTTPAPKFYTEQPTSPDPWANPFSDIPPSNPFGSTPFASTPYTAQSNEPSYDINTSLSGFGNALGSPREEISPYVQKLEDDVDAGIGTLPDPPSVIAAREQMDNIDPYSNGTTAYTSGISTPYEDPTISPFDNGFSSQPYTTPPRPEVEKALPTPPVSTRVLPSDLLDDDILGANDPSVSLKKAFVKSSPRVSVGAEKPKAYVFKPGGRGGVNAPATEKKEVPKKAMEEKKAKKKVEEPVQAVKEVNKAEVEPTQATSVKVDDEAKNGVATQEEIETISISNPTEKVESPSASEAEVQAPESSKLTETIDKPTNPTSIPLPHSEAPTPTTTRPTSPIPPPTDLSVQDDPVPSPAVVAFTPSYDRVAVSPLDAPTSTDYGFKNLSIGGVSPIPPVAETTTTRETWSPPAKAVNPPSSRFNGRGWGALDADDDGGLFGKGGPGVKSDPWGGDGGGWEENPIMSTPISGPSRQSSETESIATITTPQERTYDTPTSVHSSSTNGNPRTPSKSKLLNTPVFQITVGDPTKVGDPVRGHIVYTVRTKTTSPHYKRGEFSVLRRFSDFLWLFDALTINNPGVIVPPVPDKHPFGRFQDTFVETRRSALQKSLGKITSHPILQLDPDLRLFLESDSFALDSKNRRQEIQPEAKQSLLASWTGPKFVEQDDWFDSRKTFLDSLENQLKSLSKSIETASKARLDLAISMGDFADSTSLLADSDLGSAMCSALARLSDLSRREKEWFEEQAKADVGVLLNLTDEYVRLIGSVRLAFAARVRAYHVWQGIEKEVGRLRAVREKARLAGKLGDKTASSLAEVGDVERKGRDASVDFENISKLIKSEFTRFERERIDEFKKTLERHLGGQIDKQKELIAAWEEYHSIVLKMVQKSQGQGQNGSVRA